MEDNFSPSKEGFAWFSQNMQKIGFEKISNKEIREFVYRFDFEYRKKEGQETGFYFKNDKNNYKVKIWTTYLEKEEKLRELGEDVGFVIIVKINPQTKEEKLVYCARYFLRSNKNFFLSLARYAWIAKWKITHAPSCPICGKQMEIMRKSGTRQYLWTCASIEHLRREFLPWDYGLGPVASLFLKKRRKDAEKRNKENKRLFEETGKPIPVPKALTRYRARKKREEK